MKIVVGTTLVFETGEYSDYSFTGPFRVLREFDQAEICETFKDAWREQEYDEWDKPDGPDLIAWMAKEGYVEDIPNVVSWHVGSYGELDAEIQDAPDNEEET